MKRNILAVVLGIVALGSASLMAQQQGQRRGARSRQQPRFDITKYRLILPTGVFEKFKTRVRFSPARAEPIEELAKEYDEKILEIRDQFLEKAKEHFTEEQREEFDKMVKLDDYRRNRPRGVDMFKRNPYTFRVLARMLKFTDQQNEQIDVILKQYKANQKALGKNKEARKQLSEETFNQILTLLTPEQQEKVMNFQKEGEGGGGGPRNAP